MKKKFLYLTLLGIGMSAQNKSFAMNDNRPLNLPSILVGRQFCNKYVKKLQERGQEEQIIDYVDRINENFELFSHALYRYASAEEFKRVKPVFVLLNTEFDRLFPGIREIHEERLQEQDPKNLPHFGKDFYCELLKSYREDNFFIKYSRNLVLEEYPGDSAARYRKYHKGYLHFKYVKNPEYYELFEQIDKLSDLIDEVDDENHISKGKYDNELVTYHNRFIEIVRDIGGYIR